LGVTHGARKSSTPFSLIKKSGELELSLAKLPVPDPAPDEIVVRIEGTPINPSDLGLLVGPADVSTLKSSGSGDGVVVTAAVPDAAMRMVAARIDQAMPVGNEGAGTVVAAGSSPEAQALMGKLVAILGGEMYATLSHREGEGRLATAGRRNGGRRRFLLREPADRARHGEDHAPRRPQGSGAHRGRFQPRADAQQDLHQGRRRPREHRPQRRADENPEGHRRQAHVVDSSKAELSWKT
jgi:hypothetical protein